MRGNEGGRESMGKCGGKCGEGEVDNGEFGEGRGSEG